MKTFFNDIIKFLVILTFLFTISIYTIYTIHEDYPLPYHSDEWDHLAIAKEIAIKEKLIYYDPSISSEENFRKNWEIAYHVFLGVLLKVTNLNAIKFAIFFPTIIAFFMAFNTFILVRFLTKSELAGLLAGIFVLTIKSNVTLLGPWFLVPLAFGLAQIPLILLLFLKSMNMNRIVNLWDVPLFLVFANVTLAHPPSTVILLPVFSLYLVFHPKTLWKNKFKVLLAAGFLILLLVMFLPFGQIMNFERMVNLFTFEASNEDPSGYLMIFYYPRYLGNVTITLALIGVFSAFLLRKRKEIWILPLALLSLLPLVMQFYYTGEIFLCPYRRLFMYNLLFLLMLAGIGLFALYEIWQNLSRKFIKDTILRWIMIGTFFFVAILILDSQIESTFEFKNKLYKNIRVKDVSAIEWLKFNTPKDAKILALPHVSKAITPIAERRVVAAIKTRLGASDEINRKAVTFFNVRSCEEKKKILSATELKANYIFFKGRINCDDFLQEVHFREGNYIYKVML
jgi:hypothetical protein